MALRSLMQTLSRQRTITAIIAEQAERDKQIVHIMAVSNLSQSRILELSKIHKVNLETLYRMFAAGWTPENGWPKSLHIKDIINCLID